MQKKNIFIPGFEFSLTAGILTILIALYATWIVFASNFITDIIAPFLKDVVIVIFLGLLFTHYVIGILMIISAFLIKHKDHSLAGSTMILITSIMGILLGAGIFIGPILGLIGGILGHKEHQKAMHLH
tara:strand:- start:1031 stop:1414 length:384 start_codon:yes stop_codon:yes gene_type:complete